MSEKQTTVCPECNEVVQPAEALDRRFFLRSVVGGAAAVAVAGVLPTVPAEARQVATPAPGGAAANIWNRPAEGMIRELYTGLTPAQRQMVVKPYGHTSAMMLSRHRMMNAAMDRRIGDAYTPAQRDLLQQILRSLCSDQTGYDRICRRENANRAWDNSQSFEACGVDIYGTPADNSQWAWVFTGHHLTVRCDGDSDPDLAFGGPIYYGHTPDGYSNRNVFFHQTEAVMTVFDSLNAQQRQTAVVTGTPGELAPSIRFRAANQPMPGLAAAEMSRGQKLLVLSVMREVISPYRMEDQNEVMDIVRNNGGLDRVHLAFYREPNAPQNERWHFWRLEGPGFVWNYRVLPHVHTYVQISRRPHA